MIGAAILGTGSSTYTNVYLWNLQTPYVPSGIQIPMWQYNTRHNGVWGDVQIVGINNNNHSEIPGNFKLNQNYPNPFNPTTKIKYQISNNPLSRGVGIARGVFTTLKIFYITGREVAILVNEQLESGTYEVTFDGSNLPSGIYFYKLQAGDFSDSKKMLMIK
jgi:hypothetical protein